MNTTRQAMHNLHKNLGEKDQHPSIPFEELVKILTTKPERVLRNIFQVFHDMVRASVTEEVDEYLDDPESIHYVNYDCSRLFVEDADHPFFADRLFANRFINHVDALRLGAQQNKIYIFEGPHGSGKSTFFNILLKKFEEYVNTSEGMMYETVWRFNRKEMNRMDMGSNHLAERLAQLIKSSEEAKGKQPASPVETNNNYIDDFIEVGCPSHDNPLLIIPKHYRRRFFDDVFANDEFKWKLFTEKEYEWVFQDDACTICRSLYQALLHKYKNPLRVLGRLYVRPYYFSRRLGEGISVFNPGDPPIRQNVQTNTLLQRSINNYFAGSNRVKYIYSTYAKTNNGIYALMDVKSHNTDRLIELHNIISEGVHKVEEIEENVNSLLFALMNPEDKKNIEKSQSFSDRIEYIQIPYILDIKTEVEIYKNVFGRHIEQSFLPIVLYNFARVIVASRLALKSASMSEWISKPEKYRLYCDKDLLLLKMELFIGFIPSWLDEEDRRRLTAKRRRNIIAESEAEGRVGFSGRDSIAIFNEFITTYAKSDTLINMSMLCKFFYSYLKKSDVKLPVGFLEALLKMYDYRILQQVKEALYYYNEEKINKDIMNYIFAINFDIGAEELCKFTGDNLKISEDFLTDLEVKLIADAKVNKTFRQDTQKEYTSTTLTQEMMRDGRELDETKLFNSLRKRYIHNLKEKVLEPFQKNENFRRAIKDFQKEDFKTYDKKIQNDVRFLMENLGQKYGYTHQGAKEVCIYVIDNDLARRFS